MTRPDMRQRDRRLIDQHMPTDNARDQWFQDNLPHVRPIIDPSIVDRTAEARALADDLRACSGAWKHPPRKRRTFLPGWRIIPGALLSLAFWIVVSWWAL